MKKSLTAVLVVLFATAGFTHGSAERSSNTGAKPGAGTTGNALSVQVLGPCCINEIGVYTYTAQVSGASGSVSFQWSHQWPGQAPSFLGTNQTQDLFVNPAWEPGVNVCVHVTDAVGEDDGCLLVTWTGS